MPKTYTNELDGQEDFYNQFLPLIDRNLTIEDVQHDNLDGQIGNILVEMKLHISDLNKVAFQAVKYLSRLRIKGYPVPKRFALIDLNSQKAYAFESEDYRAEIEVPYFGSASVENQGFILRSDAQIIDYSTQVGTYELVELFKVALKETEEYYESAWFPVHVDVTNIVGLAERYYRLNKNATKSSFLGEGSRGLGEIRLPNFLKGQIIPYEGETNEVFGYVMDKLNDNFQKKDLGAFFTPPEYARLSHELVFDAIREHQESGNRDYIILDRCAGTGNLEMELNDNVPDDIIDKDILSHVIVNTYEYYEYLVLMERLSYKVRHIIPPTVDEATFMDGLVRGSNALSEEFIENDLIQQYVKDDSVTMIVFENPPFAETTSISHQKAKRGKSSSSWKQDRGTVEAKQGLKGARSNDMANVFIWTAVNYYLRQPHDSLIVFSPLKYWKNGDWMHLTFERGFAMNRRHFHTTQDTVVSCIHWSNEMSGSGGGEISLEVRELNETETTRTVDAKRVNSLFSQEFYDKRTFSNDEIRLAGHTLNDGEKAIWVEINGIERSAEKKVRVNSRFNENIVGYLTAKSAMFDAPRTKTMLLRTTQYDGNGFHLRADNFLEKLPMFAAGWWSTYNDKWWLDGVIYRSGDGAGRFLDDVKTKKPETAVWLHKVLFYTTMEYYTKIRSLNGSDGRLYLNELCLDNNIDHSRYEDELMRSLGDKTLAFKTLEDAGFFEQMTQQEQAMFSLYHTILVQAKNTANYNPDFNYGIFQIDQELNTKHKERRGTKEVNVYDYPELNGNLKTMRKLVKDYYRDEIVDGLFSYEFLK